MKRIILVLSIAAALVSCSKDGETGPAGKDGAAGTNGTNGNANVINAGTFNVTSGSWVAFGTGFTTDLSVPQVTSNIVNTGVVLVYEQFGTEWIALPATIGNESASTSFGVGTVSVLYSKTDASQITNPGSLTFRIIIIPSNARVTNIDYNNFSEVKGFYNLD